MSKGLYYIIGGVKGGARIRETVLSLANRFESSVSVLYIGVAHDDDIGNQSGFLRSLDNQKGLTVNCLNLSREPSDDICKEAEAGFNEANIVFFDGGEVEALKRAFDRYKLKDLCSKSFERGASVGGLCAGGSFLGSSIIHSGIEDDCLRVDSGAGLIPKTSISCYIGDKAQAQRLSMLENRSYQASETGLGVPVNQAITWNSEEGFKRLFPDTMGAVIYKPD